MAAPLAPDAAHAEDTVSPSPLLGKLAFCFLLYKRIEAQELWMQYFKEAPPTSYNIYIHTKSEEHDLDPFFAPHVLTSRVATEWGTFSLVEASVKLFTTAMEHDASNQKVILLSGHCLPVKSFAYTAANLLANSCSWFAECHMNASMRDRYAAVVAWDPRAASKHSQWVILSRRHVELVSTLPFRDVFEASGVPDESYFLSALRHLGEHSTIHATHPSLGPLAHSTFCYWDEPEEDDPEGVFPDGPATFYHIGRKLWKDLHVHEPTPFFARKFARGFTVKA